MGRTIGSGDHSALAAFGHCCGLNGTEGSLRVEEPCAPIGTGQSRSRGNMTIRSVATFLCVAIAGLCVGGCSYISNVIAGIGTPQSTISGSNYVFVPDTRTGFLSNGHWNRELVRAGDNFAILLDFRFLRYLQAVDPYVVVYSEAWMGEAPPPTQGNAKLQQVVLIKEGLSPNARLPITAYPILGPVSLGDDYLPVTVTLKVVVLSKQDNQQTIDVIEKVVGIAGAAAPQYAAAGSAAGAVGAAIVALNRDKIEFEHTLTFYPAPTEAQALTSVSPDSSCGGSSVNRHCGSSDATLRAGSIVVLKGESDFRRVPFEHGLFYIYPPNWLSRPTEGDSRRLEPGGWEDCPMPEKLSWRKPADAVSWVFPCTVSTVGKILWSLVSPLTVGFARNGTPTDPSRLYIDGKFLRIVPLSKAPQTPVESSTPEVSRDSLYSEKTHMVFKVIKTAASYGTFRELLGVKAGEGRFGEHARVLGELLTTSEESNAIFKERLDNAASKLRALATYQREKQGLQRVARTGSVESVSAQLNDLKDQTDLTDSDRDRLAATAIESARARALNEFEGWAKHYFDDAINQPTKGIGANDQLDPLSSSATPKDFMEPLRALVADIESNRWPCPASDDVYRTRWQGAWTRLINELRDFIVLSYKTPGGTLTWKSVGAELEKVRNLCPSESAVPEEPPAAPTEDDGVAVQ